MNDYSRDNDTTMMLDLYLTSPCGTRCCKYNLTNVTCLTLRSNRTFWPYQTGHWFRSPGRYSCMMSIIHRDVLPVGHLPRGATRRSLGEQLAVALVALAVERAIGYRCANGAVRLVQVGAV